MLTTKSLNPVSQFNHSYYMQLFYFSPDKAEEYRKSFLNTNAKKYKSYTKRDSEKFVLNSFVEEEEIKEGIEEIKEVEKIEEVKKKRGRRKKEVEKVVEKVEKVVDEENKENKENEENKENNIAIEQLRVKLMQNGYEVEKASDEYILNKCREVGLI